MYLLDANVFIQAKNIHYGFDFCPGFWEWLDQAAADGRVASIRKVHDELIAGDDELTQWAHERANSMFQETDEHVLTSLRQLSTWAVGADYEQTAVSTFFQGADYYLVGHAHAYAHVVVTHEVPSPATKKIKIPDACIGMRVPYLTTFTMLRQERVRLVLQQQPSRPAVA
jgi:hypothetical protein